MLFATLPTSYDRPPFYFSLAFTLSPPPPPTSLLLYFPLAITPHYSTPYTRSERVGG